MTIVAGRARFSLGTLPRDDFPVIAEGELPTQFELPAETLKQIIDKTRFAISTEETRYYLNGIFLHVADDGSAAGAEGRGDRRPPPRARHAAAARRRGGDARRDRAAQMRRRAAQAARRGRRLGRRVAVADQDPLRSRPGDPDLEADRRHLPRLLAASSRPATTRSSRSTPRASWKASTASRRSPPRRPAR